MWSRNGWPARKLAADVPELLEVVRLGALGGLDAERGVAARAAAAGDQVFALHLFGQGEEGLGLFFGAVDQLVGNAVVGDDREAIVLEAAAELWAKASGSRSASFKRNRRNLVVGNRSHVVAL